MKNKRPISFESEDKEVELTTTINCYPAGFSSMADIVMLDKDDDILHLSRDWLNEQADRHSWGARHRDDGKEEDIVWIGGRKNIGFKLRVERKKHENMDEMVITCDYELLIEGESFQYSLLLQKNDINLS